MQLARKLIILPIVLFSLFFLGAIASAQEIETPSVKINNVDVSFDVPPIIENGRTLVPLRKVFEVINANVLWTEKDQSVTVSKGNTSIVVTVGNNTAYVNKNSIKMDIAPKIIDSRVYVPLRFILEALNAKVVWNDPKKEVLLFTLQRDTSIQTQSTQDSGVTLFWHTDYGGAKQTFTNEVPTLFGSEIGLNTTSSLKVAPGWFAIVYEFPNYKGKYQIFTKNCNNMVPEWIGNDKVCSLIVGKGIPDMKSYGYIE